MKHGYSFIIAACMVTAAAMFISCDDSEGTDVYRNTDNLNFDYISSTKYVTIRTDGPWSVTTDDTWVTFDKESGTGNGIDRDTVFVTVTRNIGEEREGAMAIHAAGLNLPVTISQSNGIMTWEEPVLEGEMIPNTAIRNTYITIPYNKGINLGTLLFSVVPSGDAAQGIDTVTDYEVTMNDGSGKIEIPITGTPIMEGIVNFAISFRLAGGGSWTGPDMPSSVNGKVGEKKIYIDNVFDLFPLWGFDYLNNQAGMRPNSTINPAATLTINALPEEAASSELNDGHASGLTSTIRANNTAGFMEQIGFDDWTGSNNYLRPGYIRVGHQSNQPGYIISPKLSGIDDSAGPASIRVTFKVCPHIGSYYPAYGMQVHFVENYPSENSRGSAVNPYSSNSRLDNTVWYDLEGEVLSYTDDVLNATTPGNYIPLDMRREWQEKTIIFHKATSGMQLIFAVNAYHYVNSQNTFFFIKDIRVEEYIE